MTCLLQDRLPSFEVAKEIAKRARRNYECSAFVYKCQECGTYHLGHQDRKSAVVKRQQRIRFIDDES